MQNQAVKTDMADKRRLDEMGKAEREPRHSTAPHLSGREAILYRATPEVNSPAVVDSLLPFLRAVYPRAGIEF
jgi:hypothetical protein